MPRTRLLASRWLGPPEVVICKGVTRSRFQVRFEVHRLFSSLEGDEDDELPRPATACCLEKGQNVRTDKWPAIHSSRQGAKDGGADGIRTHDPLNAI